MSDPNINWHNFGRNSFKRSGIRKTCSESENVDVMGTSNCAEVEADSIEDGTGSFNVRNARQQPHKSHIFAIVTGFYIDH